MKHLDLPYQRGGDITIEILLVILLAISMRLISFCSVHILQLYLGACRARVSRRWCHIVYRGVRVVVARSETTQAPDPDLVRAKRPMRVYTLALTATIALTSSLRPPILN